MANRNSLRAATHRKFIHNLVTHTPLVKMVVMLVALWIVFSAALYLAERSTDERTIETFADALYWSVAAFSTAGIADAPRAGLSQLIAGIWSILGSLLFFGTIVATVTTYFMRPMQRPARRIIDTIEYHLEQLEDLSVDELELLKETTDSLIEHMERLKTSERTRSSSHPEPPFCT